MPDEIIYEQHPQSRRHAVLDESAGTLWFYLTDSEGLGPVADVWVRNSSQSEPVNDRTAPPRAPAMVLNPGTGRLINPAQTAWSLRWNASGDAVVLFADKMPLAFLWAEKPRGWHHDILRDCPWGHPWSQPQFNQLFES